MPMVLPVTRNKAGLAQIGVASWLKVSMGEVFVEKFIFTEKHTATFTIISRNLCVLHCRMLCDTLVSGILLEKKIQFYIYINTNTIT